MAARKFNLIIIKIMFSEIKVKVQQRFEEFKKGPSKIFNVLYDRDKIWEAYLSGFSEDLKQEHNCSCCKAFIRQIGGAVVINEDFTVGTLWDLEDVPEEYAQPVRNLSEYIKSLPIDGLYFHKFSAVGTDKSPDPKAGVVWQHFFLKIPATIQDKRDTFTSKSAEIRDRKNTLKRAVKEISDEAIDTVLELIAQGTLYRGNEYRSSIDAFQKVKKQAEKVAKKNQDAFYWTKACDLPPGVSSIRGTTIGNLLLAISGGEDFEKAVTAYEKMVAPSNYKRPTALVTPRMVEEAKKKLEQLGFISALSRRKLDSRDLTAAKALFVSRPQKVNANVFDTLIEEIPANTKELSKVDEVSIEDFVNKVLPTAKSVKVLFEGKHLGNLSTLTGPVDTDAKSLFHWDNSFGWSYTGGMADSIKEKVKRAGGKTTGWLRISLEWYNYDDLDLHFTGKGEHVYYANRESRTLGCHLDVDENAHYGKTREPVENIIFNKPLKAGDYEIYVNQFEFRESKDSGFTVQTEHNGQIQNFSLSNSPRQDRSEPIKFSVTQDGEIIFKPNNLSKSGAGVTKWGLTTGLWYKVRSVTLSPNHWTKPIGNKHWFFILDGCVSDEDTRPFYNEFLCQDLAKNRKVMEVLGGKIKVEEAEGPELSGLGFSETVRNEIYVEVEGSFKRTIKIKI